jgi:hypothetical protein
MQAAHVQLTKVDVEVASDGVGVAAGVIVFADIDVGPAVELGAKTVLLSGNVVLKPLATELASDKMLLQIASYDESSENGTMLQASPERVVVVVATAEQPFTIEQVMLPQLVVRVLPGAAVFVTFHVEHDCVQTETDDEEHELDVEEGLFVPDAVPVWDPGVSLMQNGPTQLGSGKQDPTQPGGGEGALGGDYDSYKYRVDRNFEGLTGGKGHPPPQQPPLGMEQRSMVLQNTKKQSLILQLISHISPWHFHPHPPPPPPPSGRMEV